jgi:hypothetical protein
LGKDARGKHNEYESESTRREERKLKKERSATTRRANLSPVCTPSIERQLGRFLGYPMEKR